MAVRYYSHGRKVYYYKDLNSAYTLNQKDLTLTGNDAVLNDFVNLICTTPGELWFEPTYGTDIMTLIFENAVQSKATRIYNKAFSACKDWLPMITVIKDKCSFSLDSTRGVCKIKWTLSINQASPVTLGMEISGD